MTPLELDIGENIYILENMRNITEDLVERIEFTIKRRKELTAQIENLSEQERQLSILLAEEEARWKGQQPNLFTINTNMNKAGKAKPTTLGLELQRLLEERGQLTLSELKEILADSPFLASAKNPGKKINFTLVNLKRYKYVEFSRGNWSLVNKKAGTG